MLTPSVLSADDILTLLVEGQKETGDTEIEDLIKELEILASIPEAERSVSDWKRVIQIIFVISSSNIRLSDDYYAKMLEYITKAKELTEENQHLLKENESLLDVNGELLQENEGLLDVNGELLSENKTLITDLTVLKEDYETAIDNLMLIIDKHKNTVSHRNIIYLSPSINVVNAQFGFSIGYLTNISWFTLGGGIKSDFKANFDIYISLGITF